MNDVEGVRFDVDIVGEHNYPTGFLHLEGDFVIACERYLADKDATALTFQLDRGVAEKLANAITPYLSL